MNHHWKRITPESCARNPGNCGFAWRWWGVDNSHLGKALFFRLRFCYSLWPRKLNSSGHVLSRRKQLIGSSIWADFMGNRGRMCQPPGVHVEWKEFGRGTLERASSGCMYVAVRPCGFWYLGTTGFTTGSRARNPLDGSRVQKQVTVSNAEQRWLKPRHGSRLM